MRECIQPPQPQLDPAMEELTRLFEQMKFRKKWLGGVDERDVWRKLEQLQQMYEQAYHRQAAYYQALLSQQECEVAPQGQEEDGGGGE